MCDNHSVTTIQLTCCRNSGIVCGVRRRGGQLCNSHRRLRAGHRNVGRYRRCRCGLSGSVGRGGRLLSGANGGGDQRRDVVRTVDICRS